MAKLRRLMMAVAIVGGLAGAARGAGPVQVFGNWARGDLASAHNANGAHYIGCWVNTELGGPPLLYCEANDGAGNVNFCYTQNANMVSVAQTLTSSSDIEFGWDASHACTWYTVTNFSQVPGRKS